MTQTAALRERNVQRLKSLIVNRYLTTKNLTAIDQALKFYPVLPVSTGYSTFKAKGIWQRVAPSGEFYRLINIRVQ